MTSHRLRACRASIRKYKINHCIKKDLPVASTPAAWHHTGWEHAGPLSKYKINHCIKKHLPVAGTPVAWCHTGWELGLAGRCGQTGASWCWRGSIPLHSRWSKSVSNFGPREFFTVLSSCTFWSIWTPSQLWPKCGFRRLYKFLYSSSSCCNLVFYAQITSTVIIIRAKSITVMLIKFRIFGLQNREILYQSVQQNVSSHLCCVSLDKHCFTTGHSLWQNPRSKIPHNCGWNLQHNCSKN